MHFWLALTALAALASPVAVFAEPAPAPQAGAAALPRSFPEPAHLGIIVADAKSEARKTLAMLSLPDSAILTSTVVRVEGARYDGKSVSFSARFEIVDTGTMQIEYIQPIEGHSPYSVALANHKGGVAHHLAFVVDSIDARLKLARLHDGAVRVVLDAPLAGGMRYVYVDGILPGILVELIEYPHVPGQAGEPPH